MKNAITGTLFLFLLVSVEAESQTKASFDKKVYYDGEGNTLNYRMLGPVNQSADQLYPLVIFLHGSGERGNNNEDQLIHGSALFLEETNRENYPAFVVFPQCPKDERWANISSFREGEPVLKEETGDQMKLVFGMLDQLKEKFPIDQSRIYLSGLSMGGFGTFDAIMRRPNEFAAALPICGGGDTSKAADIKHIPIWIFHGAVDSVVPAALSRDMNQALEEAGGNVRYTEYEGVDHNSWDNAFAEKDYLAWMFAQQKP